MAAGLLLIWIFFALVEPNFLTSRNLSMMAIRLSYTAILALGMLLVLLPGQIDLSVGSGVGLIGGITCVLMINHNWGAFPAMLTAVLVALVLWALMGTLIALQHIPSFIITLGGMLVYRGLFWRIIESKTIPVQHGDQSNLLSMLTTQYISKGIGYLLAALLSAAVLYLIVHGRRQKAKFGFELEPGYIAFLKFFVAMQAIFLITINLNQYRGIPLAILILAAVAALIHAITMHTPFGRYLYAIGGNREAAEISGVPVNRVLIGTFTLLGGIVALTGFMAAAYQGSTSTTVGNLMELDAIAACVIGGTSLSGGRGNVLGVLIGTLIMVTLLNGMELMSIDEMDQMIARGLVLIMAVWLDVFLSRKAR
ncbi:MAG: ATPase [Lentisphaerae bacterium]|nr:MAG: ATPase [Lentisphaerota bacterium]